MTDLCFSRTSDSLLHLTKTFLLGICCCWLPGDAVSLFAAEPISSLGVFKRTTITVSLAENEGHQILFTTIGLMQRDSSKTHPYVLKGENHYKVFAIGDDDRITDVDLAIYDEQGKLIKQDDSSGNISEIEFDVDTEQTILMKVEPYAMKEGLQEGFYGLVVIRLQEEKSE
ncbi:Hypothetical protein PBC10988_22630 [Planctomycetales bacterium 10988]|nr:Hypothetical protein PBC10988_22630 [Planctomycetales bacterium 10988]